MRTDIEREASSLQTIKLGLALLLLFGALMVVGSSCGCQFRGPYTNKIYGDAQPSFEWDDPDDGIFPNKSPRVGENAYASRFLLGFKRDYDNGATFHVGAGARNQHIGTIDVGFEYPIGRGGN